MYNQNYDVVIIGAGMGGLICGTYLAKAGYKVAIVEKRKQVGGCCASYEINGYSFDAFVHSIGSCRKNGYVGRIIKELNLSNKLKLERYDPSDVVITDSIQINFGSNLNTTILQLQNLFPREKKKVNEFINIIDRTPTHELYFRFKKMSFQNLLDSFFLSRKLQAIISVPILGNAGLPPALINAFSAVIILKEFIFDGGYYPRGGMQEFSNTIASEARKMGAEIILNNPVRRILIEDNNVRGVSLKDNLVLNCRNVVANCSVPHVYQNLLEGATNVKFNELNISKFLPSLSAFTVFLGIEGNLNIKRSLNCNLWLLPDYNLNEMYEKIVKGGIDSKETYLLIYMSGYFKRKNHKTICAFVNAPFKTVNFWRNNREKIAENITKKIESVIPNLRNCVKTKSCVTPHAIFNYTNNYMGATYGWMPLVNQSWNLKALKELSLIKNLYFVGHWTTQGFGIPSVMELGRNAAMKIIEN